MSSGNRRSETLRGASVRRRIVTPVVVALMTLGGLSSVHAQDATPAASPAAATCVTAAVSGAVASPVSSDEATPVTDQATSNSVYKAVSLYYGCLSGNLIVGAYSGLNITSISSLPDGSLLVDNQVSVLSQVYASELTLVQSGDSWDVTNAVAIAPQTDLDVAALSAEVAGKAFTATTAADTSPAIMVHFANGEKTPQTFVILMTPDKFDLSTVTSFDLSKLPAGTTYIGETTLDPGAEADTLFLGLLPGNYAFIAVNADGSVDATSPLVLSEPADLDVPDIFASPEATPAS